MHMRNNIYLTLIFILGLFYSSVCSAQTNIITEQPAGELKTYYRAGYNYYNNGGYVSRGTQVGTVNIVYGENNEVYIQDPLSKALTGAWVKGTMNADGTEITLPLNQPIYHDDEKNDDVVLAVMNYDDTWEEFYYNDEIQSVTYKIDGDAVMLQGTSRYEVLAAMWSSSEAWAEHADYDSKYTIQQEADELVTVPENLSTETMKLSATSYVYERDVTYNVTMGIDGDDMYIKGIFTDAPDAWIKGKIEGNKVTFPKLQYVGKIGGTTNSYYMLATPMDNTTEMSDFVLTYDPETKTYSSDQYLMLNASKVSVYFIEALSGISIYKATENDAYSTPYLETFDGGIDEYTVIDANNDGVTWSYNPFSSYATYDWSMTDAGDDWLITPAIRLEAGKKYVFSVDVKGFSYIYPERFEVKCGNAATADAMQTQIIESTLVESSDFTTYEGSFVPTESGNYYFGVHAISDADNMALSADNISVKEDTNTGISSVDATGKEAAADVYSIDGRLVKKNATGVEGLGKGIYIYKNKKIVVK